MESAWLSTAVDSIFIRCALFEQRAPNVEKAMPRTAIEPSSSARLTPSGRASNQSPRPRDWSGLTDHDILARYQPGRAEPMQVLEVLLKLHNQQHTARMKTVSHKTRQERAD